MNRPQRHLPFLDAFRGQAILAVFLYHALGVAFGHDQLKWNGLFRDFHASPSFLALYPLTYGGFGVAFFFVVSGFCIHLSHQQSRDRCWLNFFTRRFFRIYPPYLLAIFIFFFLSPWGSFSIDSLFRLAQLGTHILAIQNIHPRTLFGINPAFWSIAVEIQLYAIYPLLIYMTGKRGWRSGLFVAAAVEVLIRLGQSITSTFFDKSLPCFIVSSPFGYWFSWSIGAYLAQCFLDGRCGALSRLRFDVVAVTAFAVPLFKPTAPFSFMAFSLLAGVAIDRLASETWVIPKNKVFNTVWAHLSFLGAVSYSFYLFHLPIMSHLRGRLLGLFFPEIHLHPLSDFVISCAWYPFILFLSYAVYRLVEQPSIALGKAAWKKFKESNRATKARDALINA